MKILICDDERDRGEKALQEIMASQPDVQAECLFEDDLKKEVEGLVERGRVVLDEPEMSSSSNDALAFDGQEIELVILDNNLTKLRIQGARHTAEALAGYIRAFTRIPYVVSLNKNPQTNLDLRFLIGDYETRTDLALNTGHLGIQGLWTGKSDPETDSFLPWYWPVLKTVPTQRRCQEQFVESHLEDPLLESLGFGAKEAARLGRRAKGAVSSDAGDTALAQVTFLDYFKTSCRSLAITAERERLAGLLQADELQLRETATTAVVRVVAAELDRWFRRDVVGPQAVLVDLPHLVSRMPFLLGENAATVEGWNSAVEGSSDPLEVVDGRFRQHLREAAFPHDCWTKVPCFWWPRLKDHDKLNASFFEEHPRWADALFCEDISRFRSAESEPAPMEFATEFEGAWSRRYVGHRSRRGYTPASRLAV